MTSEQRKSYLVKAVVALEMTENEQEAIELVCDSMNQIEARIIVSYMEESSCMVNLMLVRLGIKKERSN